MYLYDCGIVYLFTISKNLYGIETIGFIQQWGCLLCPYNRITIISLEEFQFIP